MNQTENRILVSTLKNAKKLRHLKRVRILLAILLAAFIVSILAITPRSDAASQSPACVRVTYDPARDFS